MKTKEIKSIVMFDIIRKRVDTTFTVFVTDSFKDYDVVHNTIISMAKTMGSSYIRSVIDNTVYFVDSVSVNRHSTIDEAVSKIIFSQVVKGATEIWI